MYKRFLLLSIILLTIVNVGEVGYFCYLIVKHCEELSTNDIVITTFLNLSTIFFVAVLFIGLAQEGTALLRVWIVYSILELSRSFMTVYDSWNDGDDTFDKIFTSCDAGLQLTQLILVFIFLRSIITTSECANEFKISTIGQSIELNTVNHNKN